MRNVFLAAVLTIFAAQAFAATTCAERAKKRKLTGSTASTFIKRCERDAKHACEFSADDRKLAGANKEVFLRQCIAEAVGSKHYR